METQETLNSQSNLEKEKRSWRYQAPLVLCDALDGWDGGGGREVQEGGDIYIHIADSLHYTAETNTTL